MLDRLKGILRSAFAPARPRQSVRVVVAQGPQQLLAATSALRHEGAVENTAHLPSIAIIGHFYSSDKQNKKIRTVCENIALHCGYLRLVDATDIETRLRRRKITFEQAVGQLRA